MAKFLFLSIYKNITNCCQWYSIYNPRISLFGGEEEEVSNIEYKYYISDDYIKNKKVEIAYWKWQKEGAPKLTKEDIEEKYSLFNEYEKQLFKGIAIDINNLNSRNKEMADMFKTLMKNGDIDQEILTALMKERYEMTEYQRVTLPLVATLDVLTKYFAVLSTFSGPSSLPSIGKVGTYISKLTSAKASILASRISVVYAELHPGRWLMQAGKLFF